MTGKSSERLVTLDAEDVRARRRALGWTQEDLAAEANVSRSTVRNIEYGKPVFDRIAQMIQAALDRVEGRKSEWQKDWPQCDGSSMSCQSVMAERDYLRRELDRLREELRKREVTW